MNYAKCADGTRPSGLNKRSKCASENTKICFSKVSETCTAHKVATRTSKQNRCRTLTGRRFLQMVYRPWQHFPLPFDLILARPIRTFFSRMSAKSLPNKLLAPTPSSLALPSFARSNLRRVSS